MDIEHYATRTSPICSAVTCYTVYIMLNVFSVISYWWADATCNYTFSFCTALHSLFLQNVSWSRKSLLCSTHSKSVTKPIMTRGWWEQSWNILGDSWRSLWRTPPWTHALHHNGFAHAATLSAHTLLLWRLFSSVSSSCRRGCRSETAKHGDRN